MKRRQFTSAAVTFSVLGGLAAHVGARGLTEGDAALGVRAALERGAIVAVRVLGRPDGFLGNPKVRIGLPGFLEDAARLLRLAGGKRQVDDLVVAMNRAAESAVPHAKPLLIDAVKSMSVEDARRILAGGDDSVTQFFAGKTREPLGVRFLPVVTRATRKVALADKYNAVARKATGMGLLREQDASLEHYVTGKTLDGLYLLIAEEERKIRRDPVGAGSAILEKVFGSLR